MVYSTFTRAAAAATLLASTASAAFNPASPQNVAIYWGQGSNQISLAEVCADPSVDVVNIGFVNGFPKKEGDYPNTNFANACWETFDHPTDSTQNGKLLKCPKIGDGIKICQQNQKKVLLSLGGGYPRTYYLPDQKTTTYFAKFLIGAFGPKTATWTGPRPFGDAAVDGFDLDLEADENQVPKPSDISANYAFLVNQLKFYQSNLLISAAPQCIVPDARLADAIQNAPFDMIFTQFYNTPQCSARLGYQQRNQGSTGFTFKNWAEFLSQKSKNPRAKLYLGLPAGPDGAGENYKDHYLLPDEANALVTKWKAAYPSQFGGVMLWEATVSVKNVVNCQSYSYWMKAVLTDTFTSKFKACVSSSSVAPSSTKASSSIASSTSVSSTISSSSRVSSSSASPSPSSSKPVSSSSSQVSSSASPSPSSSKPASSSSSQVSSSASPSPSSSKPVSSSSSQVSSSASPSPSSSKPASSSSSQVSSSASPSPSSSKPVSSSSSQVSSSASPSPSSSKPASSSSVQVSSSASPSPSPSSSKPASSSSSQASSSAPASSSSLHVSSSAYSASTPSASSAPHSSSSSSVYGVSSSSDVYPSSTPSSSGGYPASTPSSSGGYPASTPSSSGGYPASSPTIVYPLDTTKGVYPHSSTNLVYSSQSSSVHYPSFNTSTPCTTSTKAPSSTPPVYGASSTPDYPVYGVSSSSTPGYPVYGASSTPGYPVYGASSSTPCTTSTKAPSSTPGYPVYGASSSSTPGYPVYDTPSGPNKGYDSYPASSTVKKYGEYPPSVTSKPGNDYPSYPVSSSTTKIITTTYVDSCETGVTTKTETITKTICNKCKDDDSVTSVYVCHKCGPSVVTYTITKPAGPPTNVPSVPTSPAKPSSPPTYGGDKPQEPSKPSQPAKPSTPPTYGGDVPKKQEYPVSSTTVSIVYITKTPVPVVPSVVYTPVPYPSAPGKNATSGYPTKPTGTGSVPSKATGYAPPQFTGAASHVGVGMTGVLAVVVGLLAL